MSERHDKLGLDSRVQIHADMEWSVIQARQNVEVETKWKDSGT